MVGSRRNLIIAAIVIVALIAIPQTMSSYITYVVALAMLYAILTASFDLMAGYTGPLSFSHAAFYGIGAYTSALLTLKVGMSFWFAFPISVVGVFIFSVIVGYPALKLRGHYFAVTTFFFGHFIYLVLLNSRNLTNGPLGLGGIKPPDDVLGISFASMNANYYLILFFCVVIVSFLMVLVKSGIGRYLVAIRENEDLAEAIGINTTFYKVLAFGISGGLAGMAGSLFAHFFKLLHPSTFAWMTSEMVVIMALVGGTGTIIGPIIGAGVVTFILEFMRFAPEWRFIIWSLMLIVILLIEPKGLMGIAQRLRGGK
ncbi:MAG: branched-chain amino acid ABC transporter permease [Parachlamydia sp.]|nr:branched-chain amino acid ABC transporter permease [Parachlamydia sp.]